jgi:hypothetical protein
MQERKRFLVYTLCSCFSGVGCFLQRKFQQDMKSVLMMLWDKSIPEDIARSLLPICSSACQNKTQLGKHGQLTTLPCKSILLGRGCIHSCALTLLGAAKFHWDTVLD